MARTLPSKQRRRRSAGVSISMVVPAVLIYAALLVVPVIYAFYYSFTEYNGFPTRVPEFIGLENYRTVFGSDDMTGTMVITAVVAVVGAVAVNVAALGLALLLKRTDRFNTFGRVVMFYPHVLSALVVGFLWQAILGPQGVVNTMLEKVGTDSLPFLSDPDWALWSMILVIVWSLFGVQLILYLAGLQAVPEDLLEAAKLDGAGRWQTFRAVTWPSLASTVTVAVITSGISLLKTYDVVVSLTGGGPAGSTKTLAYTILAVSFPQRDIGLASAQAVLLILAAAVLSLTVLFLRRRAENDAESIG
ncbi:MULTISPECIES: carbohydrate ABC transporter permease [Streptomyces]|uniref:Sugar ABC transporter permease n=1 Tax=Streptomyces glycanivorans TaxID=3033808 RepID=A0ABY9J2Q9_9ACTN|nr:MULTISPECIES: sugar ABC transporter permease [unclassified Streptomyces]TXS05217.1 sugar ABC transporter permease [Streptomyces sp. wa22]WLQ62137.1 sugar ABC transporter permease [Streptomyces sp. Alt3]WSR52777.1 sugar ABC transporter permease [Streptomyces sp. NBC_01201]